VRVRAAAVLALCLSVLGIAASGSAAAGFGISSASLTLKGEVGSGLQAGGHPDLSVDTTVNVVEGPSGKVVSGQLKSLELDLPPGLYINPGAVPSCSMEKLASTAFCDPASQVGVVRVDLAEPEGPTPVPIYNMTPPEDEAIVLGASVFGVLQKLRVAVRGEDGYAPRITVSPVNAGLAVASVSAELWGFPQAAAHDADRCLSVLDPCVPLEGPARAFLTLPGRCEPLTMRLRARSWEEPDAWDARTLSSEPLTGCDSLDFSPQARARPTTDLADSPTGLDVEVRLPQSDDPESPAAAQSRDAKVQLPEGLVLNPSSANVLDACSPEQIGLLASGAGGGVRFDDDPPTCPDASRIGTASVTTPLLEAPLRGSVYLAQPHRNPYGSLLAAYVDFSGAGLEVKVPALLSADPDTGRLTISLKDLPQLPFEAFRMSFFGGSSAPLRSPSTCGSYATAFTLVPWSAPQGAAVSSSDRFEISRTPAPGPCASTPAALPDSLAFQAGSTAALAGAYRPFVVDLRREDATGQLTRLSFSPPSGVVAKLAGVAACPDGALAAARSRGGLREQESPSCPASSRVGWVGIAAGAGPTPLRLSGSVYLAGPYEGAPRSLATIVPAVAGPLDLGAVVIRTALRIDPQSARITASSDSIPAVLEGIPLDLRSISLRLDRPGFIGNPTSCEPMAVEGSAGSVSAASTALSSRFQVGGCSRLAFKPKLSLRLVGPTHRSAHPSLRATLRMPKRGANLARLALALPPTEYLDGTRARTACSRAEYAASDCPAGSRVGYARAWSPLLERPLSGPVYQRASDGTLPDVVASLDGGFHLDLVGQVDSTRGRVRATFATLPDVPFSKFRFTVFRGRRGLLVNNTELCRTARYAAASFVAQDGDSLTTRSRVAANCGSRLRREHGTNVRSR
jgi:hypothetical protein